MTRHPPISERLIYHIWDGQHLTKKGLWTVDHKRLLVRHPGQWNVDTGPDFKAAKLELEGNPLLGDVEIHAKPSDWYTHEHHLNPRYNSVVLHAVLWEDPCSRRDMRR